MLQESIAATTLWDQYMIGNAFDNTDPSNPMSLSVYLETPAGELIDDQSPARLTVDFKHSDASFTPGFVYIAYVSWDDMSVICPYEENEDTPGQFDLLEVGNLLRNKGDVALDLPLHQYVKAASGPDDWTTVMRQTIRGQREIQIKEERLDGKPSADGKYVEFEEYKIDVDTEEIIYPDGSKELGTVTTYPDGSKYDSADGKYTFADGAYITKDGSMYNSDGSPKSADDFKKNRRLQVADVAAFCTPTYEKFCSKDKTKLLLQEICQNQYGAFPRDFFVTMPGLLKMCELDVEKMCKKFPGFCNEEEGWLDTNICKYEKEYCDAKLAPELIACARDWQSCVFNNDFDFCALFPKMCGRDFNYGRPFFQKKKGAKSCSFEIYETMGTVKNIIDFWERDLQMEITAGTATTTDVHMGIIKVNIAAEPIVSDYVVQHTEAGMKLTVPKINALVQENKEARTQANKIFKEDTAEATSYYELLKEQSQHLRFAGAFNEPYALAMNTMVGYRIPADPSEPVYLGALFGNIVDDAYITNDRIDKITNFFTYTALDENKLPTGQTRAVTCETSALSFDSDSSVAVNTYEFDAASYDRTKLADYKVTNAETDFKEFKATEPNEYGVYPAEKEGTSVVNCLAATKFDKDNAPKAVLVEVFAEILLKDTTLAVMKPKQFNLQLRAPAEKIPKTDIQVQGNTESTDAKLTTSVAIAYEIPEDIEKPNNMGFIFTTQGADADMADTNTLDQFITYRKKGSFGPWKTVVCSVTLGTAGSEKVLNFASKANYHGSTDLTFDLTKAATDALDGADKSKPFLQGRQRKAEDAKGQWFNTLRNDPEAYGQELGKAAGTKVQYCVAKVSFPKYTDGSTDAIDKEFFGEYEIYTGANLRTTIASVHVTAQTAAKTIFFAEPLYDESIKEAVKKFDEIYTDMVFRESYSFDAETAFGQTAEADSGSMTIIGETVTVPDPTEDQILRVTMKATFKEERVNPSTTYLHWLKITKDDDETFEPLVVACSFVPDDPSQSEVRQWKKTVDPAALGYSFMADDIVVDPKDTLWTKAEGADKLYSGRVNLKDATYTTSCAVEMIINDDIKASAGDIFDDFYTFTFGVNMFLSPEAATSTALCAGPVNDSNTVVGVEAWLPLPYYDEDFGEKIEDQVIANSFFELTPGEYTEMELEWKPSLKVKEADQLWVTLRKDLPKAGAASGVKLGAQLWKKGGTNYETISCAVNASGATLTSKTLSADYDANTDSLDGTNWILGEWSIEESEMIEGNLVVTCSAYISYKKPISGAVFALGSTWTEQVGSWEAQYFDPTFYIDQNTPKFDFYLNEPRFDFSGKVKYAAQKLGTVKEPFNLATIDASLTGYGSVKFNSTLMVSDNFAADDILRLELETELPSTLLVDGQIVYQYATLFEVGTDFATTGGITVGCQFTVGSKNSQKVENFKGISSMKADGAKILGRTVGTQNSGEKLESNEEDFDLIRQDNDNYSYGVFPGAIKGNSLVRCTSVQTFSKIDGGAELFKTWDVVAGSRVYESASDREPKSAPEAKQRFHLKPVDYTKEIVNEEDTETFLKESEATEDAFAVKKEVAFVEKKEAKVDLSAGVPVDGKSITGQASYNLDVAFIQANSFDEPDTVDFLFTADLPQEVFTPGAVIYQVATLSPKTSAGGTAFTTTDLETINVVCQVSVGNPDGVKSFGYSKADLTAAAFDSKTLAELDSENKANNLAIFKLKPEPKGDQDFYKLESNTANRKNMKQKCMTSIKIPKDIDATVKTDLYNIYQVKISVRYFSADSSIKASFGEKTLTDTIEFVKPTYADKVIPFDKDEGIPKEVESKVDEKKVKSKPAEADAKTALESVDASLATAEIKQGVKVDYVAVKEMDRPDMLDLTFEVEGPSVLVKDTDLIVQYLQYRVKDSTDKYTTTLCIKTIGTDEPVYDSFDTAIDLSTVTAKAANALVAATDQDAITDKFERGLGKDVNKDDETDGVKKLRCKASLLIKEKYDNSFDDLFKTYEYKSGAILYNDVSNDATSLIHLAKDSDEFVLEKPKYEEFGEKAAFKEGPSELDIFTEYIDFDLSTFDASYKGLGFLKFAGGFRVNPVYENLIWQIQFTLEMPAKYFSNDAYLWMYATIQDVDQALFSTKQTVSCAVKVGDYKTAVVQEYNGNFDATAATDGFTFDATNAANKEEIEGYRSVLDKKAYAYKDAAGDKSKYQLCTAILDLDAEDVKNLYATKGWTATVGGRYYDTKTAITYQKLTEKTYTYLIKDQGFDKLVQPVDKVIEDFQVSTVKEYTVDDASTIKEGVTGKVSQKLTVGFETNPIKLDQSDKLAMVFETDAPSALANDGDILFQYVTYQKKGEFDTLPTTVGCKTVIGDKYNNEVFTTQGASSYSKDSPAVAEKKYNEQSADERARSEESFKISQDSSQYDIAESKLDKVNNKLAPCYAVLDMGKKIQAGDAALGTYTIQMGARLYSDADSAEFISISDQEFEVDFNVPETDLDKLYVVDLPAEKSETVTYLKQASFWDIAKVFPGRMDATPAQVTGRGFTKMTGGFKLYDGQSDKWFFNLGVELPKDFLADGEIIYMYITYADADQTKELTGAVGCKIQVGDLSATKADQWIGATNLSTANKDIATAKWSKQGEGVEYNKLREPEYVPLWWKEEIFAKKPTTRSTGDYEIQQCEVEIETDVDQKALAAIEMTMSVGARFYKDDADKAPMATDKLYPFEFTWYKDLTLDWSPEIEVPATYEAGTDQSSSSEAKSLEIDAATVFATRIAEQAKAGEPGANMEIRSKQAVDAKQRYEHGYQQYDGITSSDWWWMSLTMDMPTNLVKDGEVFYQYVTVTHPTTKATETIGCSMTIGTDNSYAVDVFTHPKDAATGAVILNSLNSMVPGAKAEDPAVANPNVTAMKYSVQAADLKQSVEDTVWTAGTAHAPTAAAESTIAGNKAYTCYMYKELPKIGRNPNEFGITYDIQVGFRLYANADATTYDTAAAPSTATLELKALPEFTKTTTDADGGAAAPGSGASTMIMSVFVTLFAFIALI